MDAEQPVGPLHALAVGVGRSMVDDLEASGVVVSTAENASDAMATVGQRRVDVVLLGPGCAEPRLAARLGALMDVPLVLVSDVSEDRREALTLGAAHVLASTVPGAELVAVLEAAARRGRCRCRPTDPLDELLLGLSTTADEALTPIERKVLCLLGGAPGRYFTTQELLEGVWGSPFGSSSTVSVHVHRIRTKLDRWGGWGRHLLSVRGRGYALDPTFLVPSVDVGQT